MTDDSQNLIQRVRDNYEFQEESAEEIENDPSHEKRTKTHNKRYWHGFAAGMRYAQQILDEAERYHND
jgi:hypothetical protein